VDGESGENTDDGGSHKWRIGENVVDRDGLQSSDDRLRLSEFFLPSFTSPLMIKSFKRLTSDNLTGFNRKSSAPSSRHLQMSENKTIKKNCITSLSKACISTFNSSILSVNQGMAYSISLCGKHKELQQLTHNTHASIG
jgi:hypothetical protein